MSHIDELDEYEAELEIRLKKEYADVFGLFRYCVLTQDATYLCNHLDLQYVPQPSYPFFHLRMEDVWVWDKNRPTRIIPRAEVYTSSDVGNTQTVLGLYEDTELARHWRLATEAQRTGDELGILLAGLVEVGSLDGIVLSSTVPALVRSYEEVADGAGIQLLVLGPGVRTGIPVAYDNPHEVGPD